MHSSLKPTVYSALFVALISIGAFLFIPIGPVPIVLQNLFVLLAGLILGPIWGTGCVGVYLLMGLAGLPVFAGGTSGIGRLFGPTGGYLIGYIPAVFAAGALSRGLKPSLARDLLAMTAGSLLVYGLGVPWMKFVLSLSWEKALGAGMLPFLAGDALKVAAGAVLAKKLRPMIRL